MSLSQESPFYSIVIPTYNRAHLIEPTIQSVLAQTFSDFEIIVVDDCSNDINDLEQKLESFNEPRLTLIKHETNKNGAAARNTGINAAKGQYIAFLDSDDTWPLDRLELVHQHIEQSQCDPNKIFYGQVDFKFPHDVTGELKPQKGKEGSVAEYLFLEGGLMQTSTIVCPIAAAKKIAFDERYRRHQDYDFCLRAESLGYEFIFIKSVLSNWLRHKGANVVVKGANADFCLFWSAEMAKYMSKKALSAYKAKVLMPIAFQSGRWGLGLNLFFTSLFKVPLSLYLSSVYASLKGVVKFILAKVK